MFILQIFYRVATQFLQYLRAINRQSELIEDKLHVSQKNKELFELLSADIKSLWRNTKVRVPKHVDEAAFFQHSGALMAYVKAQLLAIVEQGLMPYRVEVGKTPLIYVTYRKKEEK